MQVTSFSDSDRATVHVLRGLVRTHDRPGRRSRGRETQPETSAVSGCVGFLRSFTLNEYPFLSYIEEAGGLAGLASRGEVAVCTAGFPTPRLVAALAALAARSGSVFQHWGDADVGGLRIWWFMRSRLACPLTLVRTTAEWVAAEASSGGRPLSSVERHALARMRKELTRAEGRDVDSARALIDALLEHGMKLEQERY